MMLLPRIRKFHVSLLLIVLPFSLSAVFIVVWSSAARAASTFTVNSTNDTADANPGDGVCAAAGSVCTLRAAMMEANALPGIDTIQFNLTPPASGYSIAPTSALPTITEAVTIDGTSQPGFMYRPMIGLSGASAGLANGLWITSGGSTIKGLGITNFQGAGILLQTGGGNTIQSNFIGFNDRNKLGNRDGIYILDSANNVIGGDNILLGNVISGNNDNGINLNGGAASGNVIQGNYIGSGISMAIPLGNTDSGIKIENAPNNIIGGTAPGVGNIIVANGGDGIYVTGSSATGNVIQGNILGTNSWGDGTLGNLGSGIHLLASNNTVGGTVPNTGNSIGSNAAGVVVQSSVGNRILGNSIFANTHLGIDLGTAGVDTNDAGDPDTGSNQNQNYPVLTAAIGSGSNLIISGTLNSTPNTTFRVEFFTNTTCSASGNGEGHIYAGSVDVTTNASGDASFSPTFPAPMGTYVAATATDLAGNTSEFSACRPITPPPTRLCSPPTQITHTPANSFNGYSSINANGTRIAFSSNANLTGKNADGNIEIFLWDQNSGFRQITNTTLVGQGNSYPSISDEGKRIAFLYDNDIFLWDERTSGVKRIVDTPSGRTTRFPVLSGDGTHLVFESSYDPTGSNPALARGIFLWDQAAGFTQIFDSPVSIELNQSSYTINTNGTRVAFDDPYAGNNPDHYRQIFLWDHSSGMTQITNSPQTGNSWWPRISGDGTTISFVSDGDWGDSLSELGLQAFVWSESGGFTKLTHESNGSNTFWGMSSNAERMLLTSTENLSGSNPDHNFDLFLWDWTRGFIQLTDTLGNNDFIRGSMSADGMRIVFQSNADLNGTNADGSVEIFYIDCHQSPLLSPANAAPARNYYTSVPVTLTWNRISTAIGYDIQVSQSKTFSGTPDYSTSVSGDTLAVDVSLPNGTYYWRVRAVYGNGKVSRWSAADSFIINVP